MLVQHSSFSRLHKTWLVVVLFVTVITVGWYAAAVFRSDRWPGGGSWVGLTFGAAAGLLCFFEAALVLRRTQTLRTRRTIFGIPLGSARAWMAAHLWLGLLTVPLTIMHTGFRFGGSLSTLLAVMFGVVIGSGLLGLLLQNFVPRWMTLQVPAETIYSQIEVVSRQYARDALRLGQRLGGMGPEGYWNEWDSLAPDAEETFGQPATAATGKIRDVAIVGAPRRVGTLVERQPHLRGESSQASDSPELRAAICHDVLPFLLTGVSQLPQFSSRERIQWYFDDLRRRVPPEAVSAVEEIESHCQARREFQLQKRLHNILHGWLIVHLPLSAALLILLLAHIYWAILYN